MPTYLDRYLAGEHEQVWAELLALGATVRDEPLYTDALAVARETMTRAKYNCELLISRLEQMGYEFSYNTSEPPPDNTEEMLAEAEERAGLLPVSLREWYRIVGSVSLMGAHPDWNAKPVPAWRMAAYYHFGKLHHPLYTDPLVVEPLEVFEDTFEQWQELAEYDEDHSDEQRDTFIIAPDYYHKVEVSGGGGLEVTLPCPAIDCYVRDEKHNMTFVKYIRVNFQWGGFPGFRDYNEDARPTAMLKQLTEGLLPI